MTRAVLSLLAALVTGCAETHVLGGDAGPLDAQAADATTALDAAASDAPAFVDARSAEAPRCGPNTCRVGEVCCNARCGICAFAEECMDFGCAEP